MIGARLAERYDVLAELGRGGMGVVYRAFDRLLEREVAVKIVPPERLNTEAEERFRREARAAARMEHSRIVPIYDFDRHERSLFFVMPIVRGTSLRERLAERALSAAETIEIGIQIAEALEYSHVQGVIHRDIKPDNIMVVTGDEEGPVASRISVKVMDFGIAAVSTTQPGLTAQGRVVGTPAYLSPEQVTGGAIDRAADIYALGAVLYECLAREAPFSGDMLPLFYQIVNVEPRSLIDRGVPIDPELDALILRCLAKAPGDRPQRARHVAEELARYREAPVTLGSPDAPRSGAGPRSAQAGAVTELSASTREQEVLSLASILGESFTPRDLKILHGGGDELDEILDRLIARGDLLEDAASSRGRLVFASPTLWQAAHAAIPRRRRRELHRRYAEALEQQFARRLDRAYDALAHHYARADEGARAVHFGLLAARKALEEGRPGDAARAARGVLEFAEDPAWDGDPTAEQEARALLAEAAAGAAAERSPEGGAGGERSPDPQIAERLGDLLFLRGNYAEATEVYQRAQEDRRRTTGDLPRGSEARHVMRMARLAQMLGRYDEALEGCVQGIALAQEGEPLLAATFEALAGLTCCWAGRYDEAAAWIEGGRERLRSLPDDPRHERLWAEAMLCRAEGNLLAGRGEPLAAVEAYRNGLPLCERIGDQWEQSIALFNIGSAYMHAGDYDRAGYFIEQAFAAKSVLGDRWGLAYTHHARARIRRDRGEIDAALEEGSAGLKLATEIGDPKLSAMLRVLVGEIRLSMDDLAGAERDFHLARRDAELVSAMPELIAARAGLSAAAREQGQLARAREEARRAYELAELVAAKEPLAAAALSLGDAHAAAGELDEAEERYRAALRLAEELGSHPMQFATRVALAQTSVLRGEYRAVRATLTALFEEADRRRDARHRGLASLALASGYFLEGDTGKAIAAAEAALQDFQAIRARKLLGAAYELLARIFLQTTELRRAETHASAAIAIYGSFGEGAARELGRAYLALGHVHHQSGSFQRTAEAFGAALRHLTESGDSAGLIDGYRAVAVIHTRDEPERAIEELHKALELARKVRHPLGAALAAGTLGEVQRRLGRLDEARAAFQEEEQGLRATEYNRGLAVNAFHFASIHYLSGDYDSAVVAVNENIRLSQRIGNIGLLYGLELRGTIHTEAGRFGEGQADLDRALDLAQRLQHQERLANIHRARGEAALWRGEVERAEAELSSGSALAAGLPPDPLIEHGRLVRERLEVLRARIMIAQGQAERAAEIVRPVHFALRTLRAVQEELEAHAALCEAELRAGSPDAADRAADLRARAEATGFGARRADALWLLATATRDARLAAEGRRLAERLPSPPRAARFEDLLRALG